MTGYFRRRKLRKAFSQYIYDLGPELAKRYGPLDQYTVMQIQATAGQLKLNTKYIAYAVALFRQEESKNTIRLLRVDQSFLNQLRQEVADSLFDGNRHYSSQDVLRLGKKASWKGGPPPNWMANKHGHTSL